MNKVLIVEDDPASAFLHKKFLEDDTDLNVDIADTGQKALEAARLNAPDVILLDLGLPDVDGIQLIGEIREISPFSEIIVLTGEKSADSALRAINLGARDYLTKPVDKERLIISIQNTFDRINLTRQLGKIKNDQNNDINFHGFVGNSPVMLDLYKTIENVAKSKENTLICGESGTGKTLCAHTIHQLSDLSKNEFIKLNSLTLNPTNADEELQKIFSENTQTTLYIENLADLCSEGQIALLKHLDSNSNYRIIASCKGAALDMVEAGNLREDLYYRLNILPIDVPSLRRRGKDTILLANYFLTKIAKEQQKEIKEFDNQSLKILENHQWPGNIRELENLLKNIVTFSANEKSVQASMLSPHLNSLHEASNENETSDITDTQNIFESEKIYAIRDLETMAIEHALKVCNGNVQEAALKLKISPATLYRKKPNISSAA